jgi:predicted aspartyl protease
MRGVVDTGAARLVLPESVAADLGLEDVGETRVRHADGRVAQRRMAGPVQLSYLGRRGTFTALVEPERESALIGAIVMEDLDLIADCTSQTLQPRDPKQIISEIE